MPRFFTNFLTDPAAAQLGDDQEMFDSPMSPKGRLSMSSSSSPSGGVRRSGRRGSAFSSNKKIPLAALDSLDELENFTKTLQKTDPAVVIQAMAAEGGKKKKTRSRRSSTSS